jgi:ABC-2 type transport system permease protein
VFAAFDPRVAHGVAHGWSWGDLAVVAAWGVVGAIVAVRRFRWDPRR